MRALLVLCLAVGLRAGDLAQPGYDPAFVARVLGDAQDGSKPWRALRVPPESASAVVEVVGELSGEELRQATFQEFLAWFRADLRKFLRAHGGFLPAAAPASAAALPVDRFGGNPLPGLVPLGRIGD